MKQTSLVRELVCLWQVPWITVADYRTQVLFGWVPVLHYIGKTLY